ncbi:MAG: 50S ribosomal protein L7/L12 [Clostridia bacterium]|nr:50S ribosomal protein L7/L12 [Clostridia bacterium]
MADINKMLEEIKGMTVVELNQLVKAIEEEFGVSAAAPVAVAAAPAAGGAAAPAAAAEEKTEFDVVLTGLADASKKVAVIKVVKAATELSLMDAKALVEGAPKAVKEGIAKADAEKLAAELKEAGATVELK